MKWRKRVVLVLLAAVVAGGLAWGFMSRPVPVETALAERGPMRVTVREDGQTRVEDRYTISAPVDGFARRQALEVGDAVERGQMVAELEPLRSAVLDPRALAEARSRVAGAKAAVQQARQDAEAAAAEQRYANAEWERMQRLFAERSVSRDELDQAETRARRAEAALRSARFAVEVARHEQDAAETSLRYAGTGGDGETLGVQSPVGGRVLKIQHKSEGDVTRGQALLEVGDVRSLEVEAHLLSADAVRIAQGTEVAFERWGGPEPLVGRVRLVEPVGATKVSALGVEEQRVWVICDFASPPEQWVRLGDGYRVEAVFTVWKGQDVLRIPDSALFRHGGGQGDAWAVFVVRGGRAVLTKVRAGHRNGLQAEILSGLKAGDRVVAHPGDKLSDGVRVSLLGAGKGG